MPRRPRPAHRAPPGQIRKSNYRVPSLSTKKAMIASKVQLGEPNSRSSKVTLEEESIFSQDFKQGFMEREEDELGTLDALKRRREEEDEDEDNVDAETDIDDDADAPRVVQWIDDENDTPGGLKQKVADEVRLYFRF